MCISLFLFCSAFLGLHGIFILVQSERFSHLNGGSIRLVLYANFRIVANLQFNISLRFALFVCASVCV